MTRYPAILIAVLCCLSACTSESMMTSPDTSGGDMENMSSSRMGSFMALNGKTTTGSATLSTLDEDMLALMFSSDFSLTDGPGLFVFLSDAEFVTQNAVNLGDFVSTSGSQDYDVPSNVALDDYTYVLVHCVPYNVTFAVAELR